MDRAKDWAARLHHEAKLHEANSFLTLTYSDANLPDDYSVSVRDLQLFMKRLRKALPVKVRFFACGEYGDKKGRPHYHVLLFGYDFMSDRRLWRKSPAGYLLYRSPTLEKIWTYGHSEIGEVTYQSAGYVARYCLETIGGEMAEEHYTRIHPITGEQVRVHPEFITMSTQPGIGKGWFKQFGGDAFPSDYLIIDGHKHPVPRYYKKQLSDRDAFLVVTKRKRKSLDHRENNTPERLAVREELQHLRAQQLKRDTE